MANFYGSTSNGYLKLRLEVNPRDKSVDVSKNTSVVDWVVYVERGSSYGFNLDSNSGLSVVVNGTGQATTQHSYDLRNSNSIQLRAGANTIIHDSDGSKSIRVDASFDTRLWGMINVSGVIQLLTIPRTSQATLSATEVEFGEEFTIYSNRASSNFAHERYYVIGSKETRFGPDFTDSVKAAFPLDMMNMFGDREVANITLRIKTFSGRTFIGQVDRGISVKVPASVRPTLGGFSLTDTNAKAAALITGNTFIQILSNVQVTFNGAAGSYSSVIKSMKAEILNRNMMVDSQNGKFGAFNFSGNAVVRATVTDSRGRTSNPIDVSINVLEYFAPSLSFDVTRSNDDAQTLTVRRNTRIAPLTFNGSQKNVMKLVFRTREVNSSTMVTNTGAGGTWTSLSSLTNSNANLVGTYVANKSFVVEGILSDNFVTTTIQTNVGVEKVIMSYAPNGVGIGKIWQRGALDVGGAAYIEQTLQAGKLEAAANGKEVSVGIVSSGAYADYRTTAQGHWFDKPIFVRGEIYAGPTGDSLLWGNYNIQAYTNANGTFVRFPDGLQICYGLQQATLKALSTEIRDFKMVFPAAFIDKNYSLQLTQGNNHDLAGMASASIGQGSTRYESSTYVSITAFSKFNQDVQIGVSYTAIGRWK